MAITVKHLKVSAIPDAGDNTLIEPSDWNDDHALTGTIPVANGGTGAATLTGYVKGNGTADMTASATVPSTDITGLGTMAAQNANSVAITGGTMSGVAITGYIPTTEKAQPLGVATLDAGGLVPQSQIPIQGDLNYQGTWNASTNTPTLVSSVGTKGHYYVVNVAGTTNLNGITDWQIGDWCIYNGTVWEKVDNTDAVTSVNGAIGTVVLTASSVGAVPTSRLINTGTGLTGGGNLSADRTIEIDSTVATLTGTQTLTNKSISGSTNTLTNIANASLTNSAITINGVSTPLGGSASVGTVTSVSATAGTGIAITGSPITSSGTLNITNTAPDQTVAITAGTGISVTGTYPNFSVTNTAPSSGGTVTSVTGTSPVVSSGGNTPAISLAVSYGDTQNPYASKTANFVLAAPNGSAGLPSFRAVVAADIPTLNQNTTGTASNVTGTVAIVNGGTGATTRQDAIDALAGAVTSGQYLRGNGTDVVMSAIQSADVPTLNQNTTGTAANVTGTVAVANGGTGLISLTVNRIPFGNGTSAYQSSSNFTFDGTTQSAPVLRASNGIVTNNKTIAANYTIPATDNAMSAGPVTISSGIVVTVSSGSRWVVL